MDGLIEDLIAPVLLCCQTYGFTHVTSSPLYAQSNDLSERTVQTVKNVLQKCKESGQDPHLAMLCLRSTPLSHDLPSPAKLLNGRMYQTNLPAVSKPSSSSNGDVNVKFQLRTDKQKAQYDKTAKQPIQPLFAEDCVRIHNPANNRWEPGVVHCVADAPRSYMVANSTGGVLRRNRRHLRRTDEPFGDSRSEELVTSSSSASPDSVSVASSPAGETDPPSVAVPPPLRRSTRRVKAPQRLNLCLRALFSFLSLLGT